MKQKPNQVQFFKTLHPEVVFAFVFSFQPKHSYHVSHPIKCPFDFLYALKPKNPV